jgi:glycine/D-amino acid oxidase-like deaminating enzyme
MCTPQMITALSLAVKMCRTAIRKQGMKCCLQKHWSSHLKKLFPHIVFKTDFKWAGNFASTKDGLPFIGSIPQFPHTYFSLGYGGNGITFSLIAAHLLTDLLQGTKTPALIFFHLTGKGAIVNYLFITSISSIL